MKYKKLVFFFTTLLFFSHSLYASNGITYHGRIVKPDNTPLESATTRFRIQIKSPNAENCLLWEEEQSRNMLGSNGTFTITIGDSSNISINYLRVDSYGWGMERVFSNKTAFTPLSGCAVGTAYIPNAADGRILEVSFKEAPTDPTWEAFPATKINFIPMAFNTLQLEGSRADEFLKINPYAGQTPITNAGVNTLLGLIAGTSTVYSKPSDPLGGDLSGTVAAGTVVGIRGRGIGATAPVTGQILKFNGVTSTWEPAADDTGGASADASYSAKGVVQFLTNQATSGLQVTAGVVSLPNTITAAGPTGGASVVPVITYDAKGRLTTVSTATVNDTTKLPLAGGTMTGPINMGLQNLTNATSVAATNFSGRNLLLSDNDTNIATLKAPVNLLADYTLTLPAAAPTNGSVLSTDGSGNLSWIAAATGSVTSVTGTAPILSSGGTTPVISLDTGLGANKIPQVGGSALGANGVVVANGLGTALTSLNCTLGQVIKFNASGFAVCGADSGASGTEFVQNGNTFTAAATLGTNDNFALNFETNNATAMTILPSGNVGVGTTSPATKLDVAGTLKVADGAESCSIAGNGGMIRYNSNTLQFCNGTSWQTLGVSGAGITTFNGSTVGSQSFAVPGTTGTAPAWSTNTGTGVHTLNIPLASTASVTSGTISKTDYDNFNNKLGASSTFAGDISGTASTISVDKIKGTPATITALATGNILAYNGTAWVNRNLASTDIPNLDASKVTSGLLPITLGGTGAATATAAFNNLAPTQTANSGRFLTTNGTTTSWAVVSTTPALSSLTAATATNTIDNLNFAQSWNWSTLTTGSALSLSSSNNALNSTNGLFNVTNSGTSTNGVLARFQSNQAAGSGMTILASGNVGIGTAAPDKQLTLVSGSNKVGLDAFGLYYKNLAGNYTNSVTTNGNATMSIEAEGTLNLKTGTLDRLTIDPSGNVGIGTTSPSNTHGLTVHNNSNSMLLVSTSDIGSRGGLTLQGNAGSNSWQMVAQGSGNVLTFKPTQNINDATPSTLTLSGSNVGIGTTSPATKLEVAGGVRIGTEATACAAGLAGTIRYNGGSVEFCNGSTWAAFGVSGAGLTSLGGQTGNTQTFAAGSSGLTPGISSASNVHTLNIPLASGAGVTSGTISKADYDSFAAKLTSPLTTKGDLLSRDGTTHVRLPAGTNGQVLSANSATASGLEWVAAASGDITDVVAGAGLTGGATSGSATVNVVAGTGIVVAADSVAVDAGLGASKIPQVGGTALGANGVVVANGLGTALTSLNCTLGQVIKFDASGFATCGADSTGGTGAFVDGGNSFAANATIGTNDNFALNFETNSTTKMTILANGNVGMGTTSPQKTLDISANDPSLRLQGWQTSQMVVENISNTVNAPTFYFAKSGNNAGATTLPAAADTLGSIKFNASNTSSAWQEVANLEVKLEATPTNTSMPTYFAISTTPSASIVKQERFRIAGNGNVGIGTTSPATKLDVAGGVRIGTEATACAAGLAGTIRYNGGVVEFCNGSTWGAIGGGATISGSGTTNAIPKFTAAGAIGNSAIIDDGTTITATRAITSVTNPIATGASMDLGTSNTHTLASVGGSAITVSNMKDGGVYNVVIEDTTSRTYTFTGCTNSYFRPVNGPTTSGTRTVYGLMTVKKGANWDCYITWSTGFL